METLLCAECIQPVARDCKVADLFTREEAEDLYICCPSCISQLNYFGVRFVRPALSYRSVKELMGEYTLCIDCPQYVKCITFKMSEIK